MLVYTSSKICLSLISVNSKLTLWKLCCNYGSVWESALCACVWLSGRWVIVIQPYIHGTAQSRLSLSTLNYLSLFCIHIFVLNNVIFTMSVSSWLSLSLLAMNGKACPYLSAHVESIDAFKGFPQVQCSPPWIFGPMVDRSYFLKFECLLYIYYSYGHSVAH